MDKPKKLVRVIIRPSSKKNEIISEDGECMRVSIKAAAQKGRANLELVKFLSRKMKRKVRIKSGFTSREKILEIS